MPCVCFVLSKYNSACGALCAASNAVTYEIGVAGAGVEFVFKQAAKSSAMTTKHVNREICILFMNLICSLMFARFDR
jgi:nucleoside permease NupC